MKLQCNSCKDGPCKMEGHKNGIVKQLLLDYCYFKTISMAKWKEIAETPNCSICQHSSLIFLNRICRAQGSKMQHNCYNSNLCKSLFEPAITGAGLEPKEQGTPVSRMELFSMTRRIMEILENQNKLLPKIDPDKEKLADETLRKNGLKKSHTDEAKNNKAKEPELMTLQKVVELCYKNGGVFYAEGEPDIKLYVNEHGIALFKDKDDKLDTTVQYFAKMWIYEPAEPGILSAGEYVFKGEIRKSDSFHMDTARKIFHDGEKNQWLNHKELRDKIRKLESVIGERRIENKPVNVNNAFKDLENIFYILKKPKTIKGLNGNRNTNPGEDMKAISGDLALTNEQRKKISNSDFKKPCKLIIEGVEFELMVMNVVFNSSKYPTIPRSFIMELSMAQIIKHQIKGKS